MSSFFSEGKSGGVFFIVIEISAPIDEFFDRFSGFLDDDTHSIFVAESGAGIKGVGDVFCAIVGGIAEFGR